MLEGSNQQGTSSPPSAVSTACDTSSQPGTSSLLSSVSTAFDTLVACQVVGEKVPKAVINIQADVNPVVSKTPESSADNDAPIPLGLFLRESVKAAIQEWRYVDFKYMLDESEQPAATFQMASTSGATVVFDRGEAPSKKRISFAQWLRSWNVYVAVATDVHKEHGLAARMGKHFEKVEELKAPPGQRWFFTAEKHRQEREFLSPSGYVHGTST